MRHSLPARHSINMSGMAEPGQTSLTIPRDLLEELHEAQADVGALARRPVTLVYTLRQILDAWRRTSNHPVSTVRGSVHD